MPYWDYRKLGLIGIPIALVLVLLAAGYLAKNGDRLGTEELIASWFCLGTPMVLLTVTVVYAVLAKPRRGELTEGYCPRCGEWLRATDFYCPQCGVSAAGWEVPRGMNSDRARDQVAERPVSRRRQSVKVQVATETTLAAQYIVEQSHRDDIHTADLTNECLADPEAARRFYHAAARRLHPDVNQGVQDDAWNHLQEAMDILREHHQMD